MPQPNSDPDLQKCLADIEHMRIKGIALEHADDRFCPPTALQEYFRKDNNRMMNLLVSKIFPSSNRDFEPQNILDGCLRGFATLLHIGEADYIRMFLKHNDLRDECMPFLTRPKNFPKSAEDQLWDGFQTAQWIFSPTALKNRIGEELEGSEILPITSISEPLGDGGSADTYRISIHESCNKLHASQKKPQVHTHPSITFVATSDLRRFLGPTGIFLC